MYDRDILLWAGVKDKENAMGIAATSHEELGRDCGLMVTKVKIDK